MKIARICLFAVINVPETVFADNDTNNKMYSFFKGLLARDDGDCSTETKPTSPPSSIATEVSYNPSSSPTSDSTSNPSSSPTSDSTSNPSSSPTSDSTSNPSNLITSPREPMDNCPEGWLCSQVSDNEINTLFGMSLAISDDGRRAAISNKSGIKIFDTDSGTLSSMNLLHEYEWAFASPDLHGVFLSMSGDGLHISAGGKGVGNDYHVGHFFEESHSSGLWTMSSQIESLESIVNSVSLPKEGFTRVLIGMASQNGKAKVFDSDDQAEEGTFKEVGTFEGTQTWESFGSTAISGDGNIIAIGAKDYSGAMSKIGRVLLYRYSSSSQQWYQLGSQIEGSSKNQRFGRVLALSQDGSRIIVGSGKGFPEVWQLNESQQEWESCGGEIKPEEGIGKVHRPGQSVDISNDGKTVVFSADLYSNKAGIAFLYEEDPEESCKWNKIQTFKGSGGPNEFFGSDVALAGDKKMLLVGANAKTSEDKAGYSVLFKLAADSP